MKKIFFIAICCLILCGCERNEEKSNVSSDSNEFVCYKISYDKTYADYEKDILSIEHINNTIVNVIAKSIQKCNTKDGLYSSKQNYDSYFCDIEEQLFCNSYVDEKNLLLISEYIFLPEVTTDLNEYIKFVENNGYKCNQY